MNPHQMDSQQVALKFLRSHCKVDLTYLDHMNCLQFLDCDDSLRWHPTSNTQTTKIIYKFQSSYKHFEI